MMDTNSPKEALQRAVEIVGGQTAMARICNVQQPHVWNWLNKSEKAPAEKVLAIEEATKGQISRYALRPDVFGPAPQVPTQQAS